MRGLCLGAGKTQSQKNTAADAARAKRSPQRPVHAVLGNLKLAQCQQEFHFLVCSMHGIFDLAELIGVQTKQC